MHLLMAFFSIFFFGLVGVLLAYFLGKAFGGDGQGSMGDYFGIFFLPFFWIFYGSPFVLSAFICLVWKRKRFSIIIVSSSSFISGFIYFCCVVGASAVGLIGISAIVFPGLVFVMASQLSIYLLQRIFPEAKQK